VGICKTILKNNPEMSKPIFIVRLPFQLVQSAGKEHFERVQHDLYKKLYDYHVLVTMDSSIEKTEFECFNATNATENDIEGLKKMVSNSLNEIK
jgi:hypothetical protein